MWPRAFAANFRQCDSSTPALVADDATMLHCVLYLPHKHFPICDRAKNLGAEKNRPRLGLEGAGS